MEFEIRELKTPKELEEFIELQAIIGGLPPKDTMSPITLSAMTMDYPKVGWVMGAYAEGKMVSFIVGMPSAEPGIVFGHMLGVLKEYRNSGVGSQILRRAHQLYQQYGFNRDCWTFEPLESPNAHIYVHMMGGRCIRYKVEHYYIHEGLHQGMPQDRFLIEKRLDREYVPDPNQLPIPELLEKYHLATTESMPDLETVLVEIPGQLRRLQKDDPAAALDWRMKTRKIFMEYINERGYVAHDFFSGVVDGTRRSFYMLSRPENL